MNALRQAGAQDPNDLSTQLKNASESTQEPFANWIKEPIAAPSDTPHNAWRTRTPQRIKPSYYA